MSDCLINSTIRVLSHLRYNIIRFNVRVIINEGLKFAKVFFDYNNRKYSILLTWDKEDPELYIQILAKLTKEEFEKIYDLIWELHDRYIRDTIDDFNSLFIEKYN